MARTALPLLALAFTLLVCAGASHAQGQRLYKWVDDQGNVHYSDRVESTPPAAGVQRINSHGIAVDTRHSALPRNAEEARLQAQARRIALRDAALLANYPDEIDLLRAHDEVRAGLDASLASTRTNIERLQAEIAQRQALSQATPDGSGRADSLLDSLRSQLESEQRALEALRVRRFELHERQNEELDRYRDLTAQPS
ncbi:MAG: DUF4124 domain-containing protein [Xanthomonadales bacterium]|nr:DUF4124 domain-containing protein [Xanthomonadales bacterium]